jgi:hypothetical protein
MAASQAKDGAEAKDASDAGNTELRNRKAATTTYERGEGAPEPLWWGEIWVQDRLRREKGFLTENFRRPAAWLLGLVDFPDDLFNWPNWPTLVYDPRY